MKCVCLLAYVFANIWSTMTGREYMGGDFNLFTILVFKKKNHFSNDTVTVCGSILNRLAICGVSQLEKSHGLN